jgi:hypothetical protein
MLRNTVQGLGGGVIIWYEVSGGKGTCGPAVRHVNVYRSASLMTVARGSAKCSLGVGNILHSEKNPARYYCNVHRSPCKVFVILVRL